MSSTSGMGWTGRLRAYRPTQLAAGAIWLAAAQAAFIASGFVLNVVFGRLLGPADYGVYVVVITILTAVNLIQVQGIPRALARSIAERPEAAPTLWVAAVRVQRIGTLLGIGLMLALAPLLAAVLDDSRLLAATLVGALAVPGYAGFATLCGYLNGMHLFRRLAGAMTLYSVFRVVAALTFALAFGLLGAVGALALAPLAVVAVLGVRAVPRPAAHAAPEPWRPLVWFSLPNVGLSAALVGMMSVDLLFVKGLVEGADAAGHYGAAQNTARLAFYLAAPLGLVLFSAAAKTLATGDSDRLRRLVATGLEGTLAAVVPCVAILVAAREPVIELLFGSRYEAGAGPLALLAPALGLLAVASILAAVVSGLGQPTAAMTVALGALVLEAGIGVPLTLAAGTKGAAAGALVASFLCCLGQALLVYRRSGRLAETSRIARLLVAGVPAAGIASLSSSPVTVVPLALAALALYASLLVVLRVFPQLFELRAP